MQATLVVIWGISVVAAAVAGAFIAHLLLRVRYAATEAQLQNYERVRQELTCLLQTRETELRQALDAKARAEQDARRLPEVEEQLAKIRSDHTQLVAQLRQLQTQREADLEKIRFLEDVERRLRETFQALASQTLQTNADEFLKRARDQLHALLAQGRATGRIIKLNSRVCSGLCRTCSKA